MFGLGILSYVINGMNSATPIGAGIWWFVLGALYLFVVLAGYADRKIRERRATGSLVRSFRDQKVPGLSAGQSRK
jgi:hypothetical protein